MYKLNIQFFTLRKELALAVVGITPIMKDITIRIIPEKKWTKRTTFCTMLNALVLKGKLDSNMV